MTMPLTAAELEVSDFCCTYSLIDIVCKKSANDRANIKELLDYIAIKSGMKSYMLDTMLNTSVRDDLSDHYVEYRTLDMVQR